MSNSFNQSMAVPAQNSVANVLMSEVVGNKTDDGTIIISLDKSLVAITKGLLAGHQKPAADSASNIYLRDIGGSKDDTEQASVVNTASLMRYQKAEIQELSQRRVAKTAVANNAVVGLADVINITDKGILIGISQYIRSTLGAGFSATGRIKLTIDGIVVLDDNAFTYAFLDPNNPYFCNNSLAYNHRFNTSLRVEHAINEVGGAVGNVYTKVAYTID